MKPNSIEKNSRAYRPRPEVLDAIGEKTLLMLVGPSAIGKSTLMNEVVRRAADFGRVSGFTTRAARSNDEPGLYRYINEIEARHIIAEGQAVQFAQHPTTGVLYGSESRDYPATYNLLDTLSTAVADLETMPFAAARALSLTAPVAQWRQWFLERYPEPSDEAKKRLTEAALSIEWSLTHTNSHDWLINNGGHAADTARKLIEIVRGDKPGDDGRGHAETLLKAIDDGLWQ